MNVDVWKKNIRANLTTRLTHTLQLFLRYISISNLNRLIDGFMARPIQITISKSAQLGLSFFLFFLPLFCFFRGVVHFVFSWCVKIMRQGEKNRVISKPAFESDFYWPRALYRYIDVWDRVRAGTGAGIRGNRITPNAPFSLGETP